MEAYMFRQSIMPVVFFLLMLWPFSLVAAEDDRPRLVGEVAYSEPMLFDYDRNGQSSHVQFWLALDIRPARGKEGESGYMPEEGTLRRYMKDMEKGVPVMGYNQFMMVPDNPIGEAVEVHDIEFSGKTASFTSGSFRVTVKDNGTGYARDSITVNDGIREYPVSLFDGDLKITKGGK